MPNWATGIEHRTREQSRCQHAEILGLVPRVFASGPKKYSPVGSGNWDSERSDGGGRGGMRETGEILRCAQNDLNGYWKASSCQREPSLAGAISGTSGAFSLGRNWARR